MRAKAQLQALLSLPMVQQHKVHILQKKAPAHSAHTPEEAEEIGVFRRICGYIVPFFRNQERRSGSFKRNEVSVSSSVR